MADSNTTTYAIVKPEVGASADTWGSKLNAGLDKIDASLRAITTTGSANAYVLTSGLSLAAYATGQTFRIIPNFINTSTATINVDGLGAKSLRVNGSALTGTELQTSRVYEVAYDGSNFNVISSPIPGWVQRSVLLGMTLTNNATDAVNDIDVSSGFAGDSSFVALIALSSGITKRLDAAWALGTNQGGLDTGSIANGTYHVFVIMSSDGTATDALFSTSDSSPTMPATFTYKRRVGSILREGGSIVGFIQDGDVFMRKVSAADVSATNPGTSAVTRTLSIPTGIRVQALMQIMLTTTTTATTFAAYMTDLSITDSAASATASQAVVATLATAGTYRGKGSANIMSNTSAQVRSRLLVSDANTTLAESTDGWVDYRGRAA